MPSSTPPASRIATALVLTAERGRTDYGICSTTFLELAFRTDAYRLEVTFNSDGSWRYVSDTTLVVKGYAEPFVHRDENLLTRIGEANPNPWLRIIREGKR